MKKVVVTGSLAFDYIMDFPESFEENILPDKLKTLSVSFLVNNFSKNFGGVAGNIAYNMSLLGQKPLVLASAGAEDFGGYNIHLKKAGTQTNSINVVKKEFTANMFLITDKNNCQIAGFYPGAMSKDETLSIERLKPDFVIVAPTVPKAMDNFVKEAKNLKIPYLYDPAQQIPRIEDQELKDGVEGADILIGNDYELALIMKKTRLSKKQILQKVHILITTLGEKGSVIEIKQKTIKVGIVKVSKVIDPTGAGDGYIAGFMNGYINGQDLKTCGQMGAAAASFAIEKYGTQNHKFTMEKFEKRYGEAFLCHAEPALRVSASKYH